MYVIQKKGLNFQGIYGVYSAKRRALSACKNCAKQDVDNYHEWLVTKLPEGTPPNKKAIKGNGFDNHIFRCKKRDVHV